MNLKLSFYRCLRHAFMSGAGYGDFENISDRDIGRWTEYDPPRSGSFAEVEEAIAAFTHPSPSASEAQVRVEALPWNRRGADWYAETEVGQYAVGIVGAVYVTMLRGITDGSMNDLRLEEQPFGSVEAAKAAAQADYERRVLSCLSTPEQVETPAPQSQMAGAIEAIFAERQRQISKGYDAAHDDSHIGGEIVLSEWGARARIEAAINAGRSGDVAAYKELLTEAAAQCAAEIERVERAEAKANA